MTVLFVPVFACWNLTNFLNSWYYLTIAFKSYNSKKGTMRKSVKLGLALTIQVFTFGAFVNLASASGGLAPQTVTVLSADGQPLTGGEVSWFTDIASSSQSYGLSNQGTVIFPQAPTGPVSVNVHYAFLPNGDTTYGTYSATFGEGAITIYLPPEPPSQVLTFRVLTPNGVGVPNANLNVNNVPPLRIDTNFEGTNFAWHWEVPGVREPAPWSSPTDANGYTSLFGWPAVNNGLVSATYNDGVVTQTGTASLNSPETDIYLPYDPVIVPTTNAATTSPGTLVPVTLTASGDIGSGFRMKAHSVSARSVVSGIPVSVALLKGSKACRGQKLSGVTDSHGRVVLKFCAWKSSSISFKATGAYVAGSFKVLVKGSGPTQVSNVKASIAGLGQTVLTWNQPAFLGGSPITRYVVTLTNGRQTITLTTTSRRLKISNLNHGTVYGVSIVAINKFGRSDPAYSMASST